MSAHPPHLALEHARRAARSALNAPLPPSGQAHALAIVHFTIAQEAEARGVELDRRIEAQTRALAALIAQSVKAPSNAAAARTLMASAVALARTQLESELAALHRAAPHGGQSS